MNSINVSKTFAPTKAYALEMAGRVRSESLSEKIVRAAIKGSRGMQDSIDPVPITDEEAQDIVKSSHSGNDGSYIRESVSGEVGDFLILMGELPNSIQRQVIDQLARGKSRRDIIHLNAYGADIKVLKRVAGGVREYTVPSATDKDIVYKIKVENGVPKCSCVGYTINKKCHHVNEPNTWKPVN